MARTHSSIMRQAAIGPLGTAGQILDVAERLARTRGFNGFNDADITTELGITKRASTITFRQGRTSAAR